MKPMTVDLSVFERFNFDKSPVGVKFLLFEPDGIEKLDRRMALCETAKEAADRTRPFCITKENECCFGSVALGMVDAPAFALAGQIGEGLEIFDEARANTRIYESLPKLHRGTVNYVVFAALGADVRPRPAADHRQHQADGDHLPGDELHHGRTQGIEDHRRFRLRVALRLPVQDGQSQLHAHRAGLRH